MIVAKWVLNWQQRSWQNGGESLQFHSRSWRFRVLIWNPLYARPWAKGGFIQQPNWRLLSISPQYLHFKIVKNRLFWGLFLPYYSSLCTKHKTLKISIAFTQLQRKIIFQTSIFWAPALHFPGCKSSITKMNSKTNPKIMSKKVVVIIRSKSPSFCVIVRG